MTNKKKMNEQELLDYLEEYLTDRRKNLFKEVLAKRTKHFTVAIEDIYQKHNASAVVRSCEIFGVQDIHIIENRYQYKLSRHVAKGAQKWLDFHWYKEPDVDNTQLCIDKLKADGYQIIATTPHNESCMLHEFDITKKAAFFFGVEKAGLSEKVMSQADGFLKIPMVGFTESLNISVAAAVILQDVTQRLRQSDIPWQLSEDFQIKKRIDWAKKTINKVDEIIAWKEKQLAERK
jgi:tRNA (guanosine-2'-O-)-methyltransferase